MPAVNPYLNFTDNCEEVFDFYKSVFGGEFAVKVKFHEMPGDHVAPGEENKIMHVALPIGEGTVLMGSDTPSMMGTITQGNNFTISINTDSEEESDRLYNAISAGGNATMPMGKVPWG